LIHREVTEKRENDESVMRESARNETSLEMEKRRRRKKNGKGEKKTENSFYQAFLKRGGVFENHYNNYLDAKIYLRNVN
jgi:hypothetical protein